MNEQHPGAREIADLFSEFPAPTRQEWLGVVEKDLKDTPFEKILWKTLEGITVQPMYFQEDTAALPHTAYFPGEAPFVRGASATGYRTNPNLISQEIPFHDARKANTELLNAISRGQTGFEIIPDISISERKKGVVVLDEPDFRILMQGIDLTSVNINFHAGDASPIFLYLLEELAKEQGFDREQIKGSITATPFTHVLSTGFFSVPMEKHDHILAETVKYTRKRFPHIRTLGADATKVHNAGANAVQEIALALAMGVEYIDRLTRRGLTIDDIALSMRFTMSVGPSFFMEIAKLRALRALWAKAVKAWKPENDDSMILNLLARTSRYYATKYDPHVNILRATVESMAAMLGGADALTVVPFDEAIGMPSGLSLRLARNTQIILQEECGLSQLADPAAGSFYIETLTDTLARDAWKLFQDIEFRGGYLGALKEGFIQKQVRAVGDERKSRVSSRKQSMVGTNVYPNLTERPIEKDDMATTEILTWKAFRGEAKRLKKNEAGVETIGEIQFSKIDQLFSLIPKAIQNGVMLDEIRKAYTGVNAIPYAEPLTEFRLADAFERIRNSVEALPKTPKVFLATYGPAFWRRARATFASGLLGCAGLDVMDNTGFESPEDIITAVKEAKPEVVVLCSDDESYPALAGAVVPALKNWKSRLIVIVAGNPQDKAPLTSAGVDDFIHVKTDAGVYLASLLKKLGIDIQQKGRM